MAIFAIIPQPNINNVGLAAAVTAHFTGINFQLDGNAGWLVAANKTAKDICDTLGITDGQNGAALVFEVASYFGRANPNIWSWIKLHWESGQTP